MDKPEHGFGGALSESEDGQDTTLFQLNAWMLWLCMRNNDERCLAI